jgi:hypothetical protein
MYHIKYSCVLTTTYTILLVVNKHNEDDSPQRYIIFPLPGFEPQSVHPLAKSLYQLCYIGSLLFRHSFENKTLYRSTDLG